MKHDNTYLDLKGRVVALSELDADEQELVALLRKRARNSSASAFRNFWMEKVFQFYHQRDLTRKQMIQTPVYRIAQDLTGRLRLAAGQVRLPDYRDELAELIRTHFPTQRAFCQATGLREDLVSHVLAGRKNVAIGTLATALSRIGYRLHIEPAPMMIPAGTNGADQ